MAYALYDFARALELFSLLVERTPGDIEVRYRRGLAAVRSGQSAMAMEDFVAVFPDVVRSYGRLPGKSFGAQLVLNLCEQLKDTSIWLSS